MKDDTMSKKRLAFSFEQDLKQSRHPCPQRLDGARERKIVLCLRDFVELTENDKKYEDPGRAKPGIEKVSNDDHSCILLLLHVSFVIY
jgi:hypothetical protein